MKKIICIFAFIGLVLISCGTSSKDERPQEMFESNKELVSDTITDCTYNIINLKDSIYKLYPNIGKNDIHTEKACTYAFMEFSTKFNYYVDKIPFKFMQMLPYHSKYIVKFEAGNYTTNDKILNNHGISFCIFGYINKNIAESLIEGNTYYISGTNITPYLDLPSGNRSINNVIYDDYISPTLSFSCVVKDIKINECKN